jgi:hypothetical protein
MDTFIETNAKSSDSNYKTYPIADIMQICPKFQESTLMREIAEKPEFMKAEQSRSVQKQEL